MSSGAMRRYPMAFEEWPLADQVRHITGKYRRQGLLRAILEHAQLDTEDIELTAGQKINKTLLAAIVLELERRENDGVVDGVQYADSFTERSPREQAEIIASERYRQGLLREILHRVGLAEDDRQFTSDTKLTKKELAVVFLTLEGIRHDQR